MSTFSHFASQFFERNLHPLTLLPKQTRNVYNRGEMQETLIRMPPYSAPKQLEKNILKTFIKSLPIKLML